MYKFFKRFFDILLSGIAILLLSPLLVSVMIILKCTGEHDIFYGQDRVGYRNKHFKILKFATMLRNSPNMAGGCVTAKNDPRILPMGGFLRKTKINELPQLLNIFLGDMSFVGPRPQTRSHFELYTPAVRDAISSVRPGLSGMGSLVFRDEETLLEGVDDRMRWHHEVFAPYKGELELWYSRHQNLFVYFAIIFMTMWSVLRPSTRIYRRVFKDLPPVPEALKGMLG